MTTEERVEQLMKMAHGDLPELARVVVNRLCDRVCRKIGDPTKMVPVALAWYAQVCERLPCSDPACRVDESAPEVVWLRSLACNMPPQPGDDDPVDPASGNGITLGHLFGRKRT